MGLRPRGQEPGLLRTHCGDFRRTWGRVHADRSLPSSRSAVEASRGHGAVSTPTEPGSPQDPLREEKVRSRLSRDCLGLRAHRTPRGRARCVDGGVSVVCVRCCGAVCGVVRSPLSGLGSTGLVRGSLFTRTGIRFLGLCRQSAVRELPAAWCSCSSRRPRPRPRRVLPASTPSQGCRFGVWRFGRRVLCRWLWGEQMFSGRRFFPKLRVSSGLRVSPSPSVLGVSGVSVCRRCLTAVQGQGCHLLC